jgi:hypothetical protein
MAGEPDIEKRVKESNCRWFRPAAVTDRHSGVEFQRTG